MSKKAAKWMENEIIGQARDQALRAKMLNEQFVDPIRQIVTPQIMGALATNPFSTELNAVDRHGYEDQYNQGRANLMNTATRGGQLRSMMAGLERDRAQSIAGAQAGARQLGIGRALQFAGPTMPTQQGILGLEDSATQGLGAGLSSITARNTAKAKASSGFAGSLGSLLGGVGSLFK